MVIQAVIFDNDGVINDSEIVYAQVLANTMLKNLGISETPQGVLPLIGGINLNQALINISQHYNLELADDFGKVWNDIANDVFASSLQPTNGLFDALTKLPYKIAVASSSSISVLKIKHKASGVDKYISSDLLFSGDDVANHKPAPDVYLQAAKGINVKPENCIAIEDSSSGVKSAVSAGMTVFAYLGGSHILDKKANSEKLLALGATLVFKDMAELPKLIEDFNKKGNK